MKIAAPPLHLTDIVFAKEFRHPHCTLSLRPFCVFTDLPVIYNRDSDENSLADLIAASYVYTRESSFARSYMVLLDQNIPVCEVDICRALQDEVCDHYKAEQGDYVIRLLPASPRRIRRRLFTSLLQTCLEYFLELPEIKRIYIECETENTWQHELLLKSGFRLREKICQEYKNTNLYHYSPPRRSRS
jgi:RimJ/RimL family protein N-acetyltransferase